MFKHADIGGTSDKSVPDVVSEGDIIGVKNEIVSTKQLQRIREILIDNIYYTNNSTATQDKIVQARRNVVDEFNIYVEDYRVKHAPRDYTGLHFAKLKEIFRNEYRSSLISMSSYYHKAEIIDLPEWLYPFAATYLVLYDNGTRWLREIAVIGPDKGNYNKTISLNDVNPTSDPNIMTEPLSDFFLR